MQAGYARALMNGQFFSSPKFIAFFTFLTYVLTGNTLTAEVVFVTITLFNPVRFVLTVRLPLAIQFGSEAMVSVRRIEDFLLMEESNEKVPCLTGPATIEPKAVVSGLSASWDQALSPNILEDISFEVGRGQLLTVIGPVGAGKTSLLMAILGELPLLKGKIEVEPRIAYVSQQPWVFSASVRQNITFGMTFDVDKYNRVIHAVALTKDLALMPEGDQTLVGERGVSLSGGQKARVSLARALYSDADVYLLDDPLSAVDTQVGRHIFKKCICGILKDKPRILVTHQVNVLEAADQILVLKGEDGVKIGTYKELTQCGVDFESLLKRDKDKSEVLLGSLPDTDLCNSPYAQLLSEGGEPIKDSLKTSEKGLCLRAPW
jgi:ATP-binding cassette subfamily C (CFTR/MRP) protein 4